MDYPVTKAVVAHLLEGLGDSEARRDTIEARVAAAIALLPEGEQRKLTVENIFAGAIAGIKLSPALRAMVASPAFKPEPIISQLRRAQAAYIEAHDAYRADPARGRRVEEMRWAHGRLAIVQQCYDGMIAALPPAKREAAARPKIKESKAIVRLRLGEFSGKEQKALRFAATDRDAAIAQIDALIAMDPAPNQNLRIAHSYLINPDRFDELKRWLVSEMAALRDASNSASLLSKDPAPAEAGLPSPDAIDRDYGSPMDAATKEAIATLAGWLDRFPSVINRFEKTGGLWTFTDEIKARSYASAYALVAGHSEFQALIEKRKVGAGGRR